MDKIGWKMANGQLLFQALCNGYDFPNNDLFPNVSYRGTGDI